MNRLYVVEPTPSVTGSSADHRLPLRASEVELFARALAGKLGIGGAVTLQGEAAKWLDVVAADLQKEHTALRWWSLASINRPRYMRWRSAINAKLGNVGSTLYYTEPVEAEPAGNAESLRDLCSAISHGKVDQLLILGVI